MSETMEPVLDQAVADNSLAERVSYIVQDRLYENCDKNDSDMYGKIIDEVEAALLRSVLLFNKNNQSKAAKQLGLSRGTLRTKLRKHFGDTYVRLRD